MKARATRQQRFAKFALALGLAAIGSTLTGYAVAGCGQFNPLSAPQPSDADGQRPLAAGFLSAVYRPGSASFARVLVDDRDPPAAGIVGTWRFTLTSDGTAHPVPIPYGGVIDFGTMQWHSDGTEFTISGSRPPSSGDVCMGSWKQTGPSTYELKHIALAWASSDSVPAAVPAVFVGPAIIRQTITLNHARNAFEGAFSIDQYARDEVTLLEHVSGTVTATRFSAD